MEPLTELAWVRLVCHARRKESDGTLSVRQCRLALAGLDRPDAHLDALAASGLLARGADGEVTIRSYGVWQQTGTEFAAQREKWNAKKRGQRHPETSPGESPGDTPGDSPESPRGE